MIVRILTAPPTHVGKGYIAGRDEGIVTAGGQPDARPIYLFDARDMRMLRTLRSNATGHYIFAGLDETQRYLLMARDNQRHYEPVAYDQVKPATDLTLAEQQALIAQWYDSD